jgi:small GTP-binding protein
MTIISKKICLIGDFGVGKTSLIRRFVDRQFSDRYLSTVGVKISRKMVELPGENDAITQLQLMIWDVEGKTQFKAIAPSYLQGAKGGIIVADASRPKTVISLAEHADLFQSVNKGGRLIVAINKTDLVSREELMKLVQIARQGCKDKVFAAYATSAKTGAYVDDMFEKLSLALIK